MERRNSGAGEREEEEGGGRRERGEEGEKHNGQGVVRKWVTLSEEEEAGSYLSKRQCGQVGTLRLV